MIVNGPGRAKAQESPHLFLCWMQSQLLIRNRLWKLAMRPIGDAEHGNPSHGDVPRRIFERFEMRGIV
jgi:hypothetical protein